MYIGNYRRKVHAVFLCFFIILALSIARLFFIQFFRSDYLKGIARKQHNLLIELEPLRGAIYDVNLRPQAVNIQADSLYACPKDIPDKEKESLIKQLAPVLKLEYAYLKDRIYRDKAFIWIARKITPEQAQGIRDLKIKGIDFLKESKRCYPNAYLASHIIGFSGLDNVGLEGAELYYDKYLKGQVGWELFLRDARQKKLGLREKMLLPKDGYDIVLTIDEAIQYIAERELDRAYKAYRAKAASIIVIDPYTGAVLAMANRPTYDLNDYTSAQKDDIRNRAVCDIFEPGSVFKIVTASAVIEEKKVSEEDKFFCENGSYKVGPHVLHDHRPHGWLTFQEVIEQSSNIGTVKVAQVLGNNLLYRYIKLFGFGAKTDIELPGEVSGMIKEPRAWSKISIAAIPIGHEVGVTVIQLAAAISVIANGGQLVKPYIIREIRDKYGERIKKFYPTVARRVISENTAKRVRSILTGAVERGTATLAKVSGFSAGGKTGTAQKIEPNGTYSHDRFVASFIGFAPAENPVLAIVVILDEPRPYYFGGVVAAPVFKNVAAQALRYLRARHLDRQLIASNESKTAN